MIIKAYKVFDEAEDGSLISGVYGEPGFRVGESYVYDNDLSDDGEEGFYCCSSLLGISKFFNQETDFLTIRNQDALPVYEIECEIKDVISATHWEMMVRKMTIARKVKNMSGEEQLQLAIEGTLMGAISKGDSFWDMNTKDAETKEFLQYLESSNILEWNK